MSSSGNDGRIRRLLLGRRENGTQDAAPRENGAQNHGATLPGERPA